MTSRLDRLFVLLEAGAGAATRRAAARQLGEVQKAHPEELHRLLARLMKHLRSPVWETRVAASQAVEAILANVPEWHPPPSVEKTEEKSELGECGRLRCDTFDLDKVLQNGEHLMGSQGSEYDLDEETLSAADLKESLAKQRQLLNARLGLDVASGLGVDLSSMYSNEDLIVPKQNTPAKVETPRRPIQELLPLVSSKHLSSREINLAKRKARQAAFTKQKSRDCSEESTSAPPTPPAEPDAKKIKLEPADEFAEVSGPTPDVSGTWGASNTWPLEWWSSALQVQLLAVSWEARHGAATALRALLRARVHATAAHAAGNTQQQNEDAHQEWLEDMALRFICVLALDRFGDFVSDQVVAPVRETAAQALGVALSQTSAGACRTLAGVLARLARHSQWEARHGALLGFKYLLAARQEVACEVGVIEQLVRGLEDAAEDVSAVAAGALAPPTAAGALAGLQNGKLLNGVVARLWQLLRDQDDLAAPANSYMALLASLMALPQAAQLIHPIDLSDVLPRLWPYLDHTTSSVRKATLQTMCTLTRPLVNKTANGEPAQNGSNGHDAEYLVWTPELLQQAMRYVYQRVLVEHVQDIQDIAVQVWENLVAHAPLEVVLVAACPLLATWLCLAMQPPRVPLDPGMLLHQERRARSSSVSERAGSEAELAAEAGAELRSGLRWYIGGGEAQAGAARDDLVMRARCRAAHLLGYLSCYLVQPAPGIQYKPEDESPIDCYVKVMTVYLKSGSALQRLVCGMVLSAWAARTRQHNLYPPDLAALHNGNKEGESSAASEGEGNMSKLAPPTLTNTLHTALNQALYYDEVAVTCNRILQEARDLHAMMKHYKLPVDGQEFTNIIRLEQVVHLTEVSQPMIAGLKSKRVMATLEERRRSLQTAVNQCASEQTSLNISVQAALASAAAQLEALPAKLNPVVRPLMESVKRARALDLQALAAGALACLARLLASRTPSPNNKILANLKAFLRCDPEFTPRIVPVENPEEICDSGSGDSGAEGRFELDTRTQPQKELVVGIVSVSETAAPPAPRRGRPPAAAPAPDAALTSLFSQEDEARKALVIQRRGATLALSRLTQHFGAELPERLPKLWEFIVDPFKEHIDDAELEDTDVEAGEELISKLQVFEVVCPYIAQEVWADVARRGVAASCRLCRHRLACARHLAARALAAFAARDPVAVMPTLIHQLVPALEESQPHVRCGAAEATARVVDALQLGVVPYIVLLVVPLLGRMSDSCEPVRVMSTRCFASLIQLMPLDGAIPPPDGLSQDMYDRRNKDKMFLEQLFNPKAIKDYKIPVPVSAQLRSYQQAGVNWLRFLYSYKLHGVLCDDMGLGKTLQSIIAVAGSHWERARDNLPSLCSLVVCPPTLTGHWVFEVNKFIPTNFLKPLQYVGPPLERERLRSQVQHYNLIVASYDIVRKDIDFFSSITWNYCILDEGHVIKNGKTKAFKAIKMLVANHRLILSGTPIQNNVLELWSLFDFLMPGLLGSERVFTARYSRPILAARDNKATPLQLQAGALAVEALHRQVLPFLLRRVKEDVLKELPPKITQDYYCELSPLQRLLYSHVATNVTNTQHTHVFQALHYLQNVCNHPKLVLSAEHPAAARVQQLLAASGSTLDDIAHANKLVALKQLLLDCGIGVTPSESDSSPVVSQHRALVFCQLKKMLDIVEQDLLKKHLPRVSYLRLDGSVPPQLRQPIVARFNCDVSIDLLLLTTAVGGLGLNLTGADTVIFVEHDWNPMKDVQAMDRAHRIGQRRVVNVYRLVTRDTLEEKIMGLQKFKMVTANTVISSENAAIETMGTDQLLDLFQLSNTDNNAGRSTSANTSAMLNSGPKAVIDNLPDLWDDKQYEEEYDMTSFVKSLNNSNLKME